MAKNKVRFLRGTAAEYANAVKDEDTFYYTTNDGKLYIGNKEIAGGDSITIDTTITSISTNANAAGSKAVYDFVTAAIANLKTFSTEIVETLPTTGESNILYLVAKTTAESGNVYDEYLYINGAFELIGTTAIDLSGYAQSNEMHALTNTEIAAIITAAKA